MHVPVVNIVTVNPEIVHTLVVEDINVTVKLDDAVAVRSNGVEDKNLSSGPVNGMTCVDLASNTLISNPVAAVYAIQINVEPTNVNQRG